MATHSINSNCTSGTGCANLDCGNCGECQLDANGNGTCIEDITNTCNCVNDPTFGTWNCESTSGCTDSVVDVILSINGCTATVELSCGDCCEDVSIRVTAEVTPNGSSITTPFVETLGCLDDASFQLIGTTGQIFISAIPEPGTSLGGCTINIPPATAYDC